MEFDALSSQIANAYPNAKQRWSLIVYRDEGDAYVVESHDFSSDVQEYRGILAEQAHGGGGDFPEAPDQALAQASQLDWRDRADTARLLFWVADAPHHAENVQELEDAVLALQELDVHVYPVASSGVDELSEYSMRSAAQLTGGRYLFLTDDSGFGGSHKEPTIPCYNVTGLDVAVFRMIELEMTGNPSQLAKKEVIRSVGEPDADGTCQFASGNTARAL